MGTNTVNVESQSLRLDNSLKKSLIGQVLSVEMAGSSRTVFWLGHASSESDEKVSGQPARVIYQGGVEVGSYVQVIGSWHEHPKYGLQFRASSIRQRLPQTVGEIETYLVSSNAPFIDAELAQRLVATFGEKTLDIIESAPRALTAVQGIRAEDVNEISKFFRANSENVRRINELVELGVDAPTAIKLYKRYGNVALSRVKRNPYELLGGFPFFDFRLAETVASVVGFESALSRTSALIGCAIRRLESSQTGSIYELSDVIRSAQVFDSGAGDLIVARLGQPIPGVKVLFDQRHDPAVTYLTVPKYFKDAMFIVDGLAERQTIRSSIGEALKDPGLSTANEALSPLISPASFDKTLLVVQTVSIEVACDTSVELASAVSTYLDSLSGNLVSVTAVGAERIRSTTGQQSPTLHALLNDSDLNGQTTVSNWDWIIVYSADHLSATLFARLLKAVKTNCSIILIGDCGNAKTLHGRSILPDLAKFAEIHGGYVDLERELPPAPNSVVTLAKSFSGFGAQRPALLQNAESHPNTCLGQIQNQPLSAWWTNDDAHSLSVLPRLIKAAVARFTKDNVLVFSPSETGFLGFPALNDHLLNIFNPSGREGPCLSTAERLPPRIEGLALQPGDRLTLIKNVQSKIWRQGDFATITSINYERKCFSVKTSAGAEETLGYAALGRARLGWAVPPTRAPAKLPMYGIFVLDERPGIVTGETIYQALRNVQRGLMVVGPKSVWERVIEESRDIIHKAHPGILSIMFAQRDAE